MTLLEDMTLNKNWLWKLLAAIVLTLTPLQAEERPWFSEPRATPVQMLRHLFESPVTSWPTILKRHEYLLNEQFFENVDKRILWGMENEHYDDAARFSLLRRYARQTVGLPLTLGLGDWDKDAGRFSLMADGVSWGDSDFTQWPDEIRAVRGLLSEDTYHAVARTVDKACVSGNFYRAAEQALLGDIIAAELGFTGDLRLRVVQAAGVDFRPNVPMDLDPRVVRNGYIGTGMPSIVDSYWQHKFEEAMQRR